MLNNNNTPAANEKPIVWPDFSKDNRAWELAKVAAEPGEALSITVQRAQRIKEAL